MPKHYGGLTGEQRRQARREALIEAALDIIAAGSTRDLKVRAVCETAKLNDRYFYESFSDCDALLVAAFDSQFAGLAAALQHASQQSPPARNERIRNATEAAFAYIDVDPRRHRLLAELRTSPALQERRALLLRALADVLTDEARRLVGDAPDVDRRLTLSSVTLVGGLLELVTQWIDGLVESSREELIDFMVALLVNTSDISSALGDWVTDVQQR